jgi:glucosyl-dolichyl phosphate glucuronosyltransferase
MLQEELVQLPDSIAVAICTYNRAESLREVLQSMVALRGREHPWQLFVIDNNSRDGTKDVVLSFSDRLPVTYCFEPEQGLSAARNHALRVTREFTHLLFTDDDVRVDSNWLAQYREAFERYPAAGYFGGRVIPFYPAGKPRWLHDESLALIDGLLVRFHLGEAIRPFAANEQTPFGASFALSRRCIDRVGEFRTDLGVKGGIQGRGEEADYMERAIALGETGLYVGSAIVNHATDPRRLTLGYLYRYGIQKGIAARRMGSTQRASFLRALSFALRGLIQLAKGRGDRMRQCLINIGIERGLSLETSHDA